MPLVIQFTLPMPIVRICGPIGLAAWQSPYHNPKRKGLLNGFAVRQTIDHNPKRERGTQGSAESLAHAAGWDLGNTPVRFSGYD